MSIVMNMFWSGLTASEYDRVDRGVGWREDVPPGGRYHIAWFTGDGGRIVDVWDSQEHFETFVQARLTPGVQKVGVAGEPEVAIWPLYDLQIEGDPPPGCVVSDGTSGGMPEDLYQRLERSIDWKGNPPPGAVLHIAALDGDTIRDVGVWRSSEAIDAFMTGPLTDAAVELGVDEEFEDEPTYDLHAWFDPTKTATQAAAKVKAST